MEKHIQMKMHHRNYKIYSSLPQSLGPGCPTGRCLHVFTCTQGLHIPQRLDLGCCEQMVIITKAQKAVKHLRCCLKLLCSQTDFSNLDGVILFQQGKAKVASF